MKSGKPDAFKGIIAGVVALLAIGFLAWYFLRPTPNPGLIGGAGDAGAGTAAGGTTAGTAGGQSNVMPLPGGKGKR
jgi:hypothetical protein